MVLNIYPFLVSYRVNINRYNLQKTKSITFKDWTVPTPKKYEDHYQDNQGKEKSEAKSVGVCISHLALG